MRLLKLILLFGLLLVATALGIAGLRVHTEVQASIETAATARLDSAVAAYRALQTVRASELALIGQQLANDKAFVGYLAHALSSAASAGGAVDTASIRDLLDERRSQLDFDVALVLDTTGHTIVDTSAFQTALADLSRHPTIASVIRSLQPETGHLVDRGQVLQIAVSPLLLGASSEGMLVVGQLVDEDFVKAVGAIAKVDMAIVANTSDGPIVAASSLDPATAKLLSSSLAERHFLEPGANLADQTLALSSEAWTVRLSAPVDRVGEGWLVCLVPIRTQLAALAAIDRSLLLAGSAVFIAVFILFAIWWNRVLSPLTRLGKAAAPILEGHLDPVKFDLRSSVGQLGLAINRVVGELRESRDFETYAADLLRQRTRGSESKPTREVAPPDDHGAAANLKSGSVFAERYEVYGRVGSGHSGVVYRALDKQVGEVVALKLIGPAALTDRDQIERMKQLLRSASRVHHPNVARMRDMGQHEGIPYIASEYVRGISLRDALARTGRVPLYAGLRIARQVTAGLAAVHQAGQPHGAVNPSNVILEPGVDAKLLDAGVLAPRVHFERLKPERPLRGDVSFLSPQQLLGEPPSLASDVYALGVMLTEAFTALLPQPGQGPGEIALARIEQDPLPPSRLWTEIPRPLEIILLRCLDRDPSHRYSDASAVQQDLNRCRL